MITSHEPTDWRDLQHEVARILRECGFAVEVEKTIQTVRSQLEVNVPCEEIVKDRKQTILCECKHSKSPVPQEKIHSFRSVVADSGAHLGYIISSNGFQSGSFAAADLTNLRLLTWQEFQNEFEPTWIAKYYRPLLGENLNQLVMYTAPLLPSVALRMEDEQQAAFAAVAIRHEEFGLLALDLSAEEDDELPLALPLRQQLKSVEGESDNIPASVLDARSYREFLDAVLEHSDMILREFDHVIDS